MSDADLDKSFDLPPVDSLERPGFESLVNDDALRQFLTQDAEVGRSGDSPETIRLSVFPIRWRQKKPQERRELLTTLLGAVLNFDLAKREKLTIAVEPGVAALLFYGILRLLPGKLAQPLSFSTFESHMERSATVLTAHDFFSPATDFLPETYRIPGLVINTYKPLAAQRSDAKRKETASRFAESMVETFVAGGGAAADQLLAQISAAGASTAAECESLLDIHGQMMKFVRGDSALPDQFSRLSKTERQFAGRILSGYIDAAPNEVMRSISSKPSYLTLLDLICNITDDQTARRAEKKLAQVLPNRAEVRDGFFAMPKLSAAMKVAWLRSHLKQKEHFPEGCDSLWTETSLQPDGVLSLLMEKTDADQILTWFPSVPRERYWCLAAALGIAAETDPAKRPLLMALIEKLDDDGLCQLFGVSASRTSTILSSIEPGNGRFLARMTLFSDRIRQAAHDKVVARVDTLLAVAKHVPFLKVALARWSAVRDCVRRCEQQGVEANGRISASWNPALGEVLKSVANALSEPDADIVPIEIDLRIVESMLTTWIAPGRRGQVREAVELLPTLQLSATGDTELCDFLAGASGKQWLQSYPTSNPVLPQRLIAILDALPENLSTFPSRLDGLLAARRFTGTEASRVDVWQRLMKMLLHVKGIRDKFTTISDIEGRHVFDAAKDLAPLVYVTLKSHMTCDPSKKQFSRLNGKQYLERLSRATIGDNTLVECKPVLAMIEAEFVKQSSANGGLLSGLTGLFKP